MSESQPGRMNCHPFWKVLFWH